MRTLASVLTFAVVLTFAACVPSGSKRDSKAVEPESGKVESPSPATAAPAKPAQPTTAWVYDNDTDDMGRPRAFAMVRSENTLNFGFPYQGEQHATLTVRKMPESGTNVILRIEKGQFACGVTGCTVNVRFDEGAIVKYTAGGSTSHDTTILFFENESRFVASLKKAKVLRIEPTFYREGNHVLTFKVDGFQWK